MMNLKTEKRTIDGLEVESSQFGFFAASEMWWRLGEIIAPALGKVGDSFSIGSLLGMNLNAIAPALSEIFSKHPWHEIEPLVLRLLSQTKVRFEGKWALLESKERIERIFAGRMPTGYKVVGFALEANFRDFFSADSSAPSEAATPEQATEIAANA